MDLRRLSWAGIEAIEGQRRLVVDALEDAKPLRSFLGAPRTQLVPVDINPGTWALVTHLHADHCDWQLLARMPAGQILCHEPSAARLVGAGVRATALQLWETCAIGPFRVTPVPSHDRRADDQVAWVIESSGRRVIHCGDTIWHGHWYEIARRCGPFDIAFLPINGVIVRLKGFTPTDVPATLTPEQAIEAAVVLDAGAACAIHHTVFHNPPLYTEQPDAVQRFLVAGRRRHLDAIVPPDGELP